MRGTLGRPRWRRHVGDRGVYRSRHLDLLDRGDILEELLSRSNGQTDAWVAPRRHGAQHVLGVVEHNKEPVAPDVDALEVNVVGLHDVLLALLQRDVAARIRAHFRVEIRQGDGALHAELVGDGLAQLIQSGPLPTG